MTSTKKIIKKKLKEPDEFISFTEKIYLFVSHHAKSIALGAAIVVILLVVTFLFQAWNKKETEGADRMLSDAMENYQMVSSPYREASPQEYKNAMEKFNEVIATFPKTESGKLAVLYKGNIHFRLGEWDEAIKAYNGYLEKAGQERLYRVFAMEGLGYAYEDKKDYEKAVQAFQKVVDLGQGFQLADAYLGLGRCSEKLGKTKEALESYRSFLKISGKSQMANIVLRKISNLEK